MPPAIATAEKEILDFLQHHHAPVSVPDIVTGVRQNKSELRERDIRPGFWTLAASGRILVDSSFRASLTENSAK